MDVHIPPPFLVHAWLPASARGLKSRDQSKTAAAAAAGSSVGTGPSSQGTEPSSQGTAPLESSPSQGQGSGRGKRKIEDPAAGTSVEAEKGESRPNHTI